MRQLALSLLVIFPKNNRKLNQSEKQHKNPNSLNITSQQNSFSVPQTADEMHEIELK